MGKQVMKMLWKYLQVATFGDFFVTPISETSSTFMLQGRVALKTVCPQQEKTFVVCNCNVCTFLSAPEEDKKDDKKDDKKKKKEEEPSSKKKPAEDKKEEKKG